MEMLTCTAQFLTADNLLKGTLKLLEFETLPENRLLHASGGFTVCSARTRYFWLCEKCLKLLRIRRWNSARLLLGPLFGKSASLPATDTPGMSMSKADSSGQARPY
jgi:hypothetical protein